MAKPELAKQTSIPIPTAEINSFKIKGISSDEAVAENYDSIGVSHRALSSGFFALRELRKGVGLDRVARDLIAEGGDADTNGAVAGPLMGAFLGFKKLPSHHYSELREQDQAMIDGISANEPSKHMTALQEKFEGTWKKIIAAIKASSPEAPTPSPGNRNPIELAGTNIKIGFGRKSSARYIEVVNSKPNFSISQKDDGSLQYREFHQVGNPPQGQYRDLLSQRQTNPKKLGDLTVLEKTFSEEAPPSKISPEEALISMIKYHLEAKQIAQEMAKDSSAK